MNTTVTGTAVAAGRASTRRLGTRAIFVRVRMGRSRMFGRNFDADAAFVLRRTGAVTPGRGGSGGLSCHWQLRHWLPMGTVTAAGPGPRDPAEAPGNLDGAVTAP